MRKYVRQFRDHPALLAWYLNDELGEEYMARLESHYRWVREEFPGIRRGRVVSVPRRRVLPRDVRRCGHRSYPIGLYPTSMVSRWTPRPVVKCLLRPIWQVVQVHDQGLYQVWDRSRVRTPTEEEIRNMAWQSLCEGATGLMFYSWDDVKQSPTRRLPSSGRD